MTTVNTLLNIDDLSLTTPSVAFDAVDKKSQKPIGGMRFMNILKKPGNRKLLIRVHGVVASELNTEFDNDFFKFRPNDEELENLLAIEKLTDHEDIPDDYEQRSALNDNYELTIKFKLTKQGSFKATVPFTVDNVAEALIPGKPCTIEVIPSFYFHVNDKDPTKKFYGVFYQLQALKFIDDEPVKTTGVKAKGKSRIAAH